MSKYGVFSGPYFPAFGLNTERYGVSPEMTVTCSQYLEYLDQLYLLFATFSPMNFSLLQSVGVELKGP